MPTVHYHGLWELLQRRKMTMHDLAEKGGVSEATLTRMRAGRPVSLTVLAGICLVLDCDIGDIASMRPRAEREDALLNAPAERLAAALSTSMKENGMTVYEVARRVGLARNTVKAMLRGESTSRASRRKLTSLGSRLTELIQNNDDIPLTERQND